MDNKFLKHKAASKHKSISEKFDRPAVAQLKKRKIFETYGSKQFEPLDISNCIMWLQPGTIQSNGLDGSAITGWNSSILQHNATVTSSSVPTLKLNAIGSYSGVQFYRTGNTILRIPSLDTFFDATSNNAFTAVVVAKPTSATTANQHIFGTYKDPTTTGIDQNQFKIGVSQNKIQPAHTTVIGSGTSNITNSRPYIFCSVCDRTNLTSFLNGNMEEKSQHSYATRSTLATCTIGSAGYNTSNKGALTFVNNGHGFTGVLFEVILYSRALSAKELVYLHDSLKAKYGISGVGRIGSV